MPRTRLLSGQFNPLGRGVVPVGQAEDTKVGVGPQPHALVRLFQTREPIAGSLRAHGEGWQSNRDRLRPSLQPEDHAAARRCQGRPHRATKRRRVPLTRRSLRSMVKPSGLDGALGVAVVAAAARDEGPRGLGEVLPAARAGPRRARAPSCAARPRPASTRPISSRPTSGRARSRRRGSRPPCRRRRPGRAGPRRSRAPGARRARGPSRWPGPASGSRATSATRFA